LPKLVKVFGLNSVVAYYIKASLGYFKILPITTLL
jgi:hypothetical protein